MSSRYERIVLTTLKNPKNLCHDYIFAQVKGDVVMVMVKDDLPEGLYTIFTKERLKELKEQVDKLVGK